MKYCAKNMYFKSLKIIILLPFKEIRIDKKIMEKSILNKLNQFEEVIKLKRQQVNQSNPKNILKKGYAIVRDEKYKIIKRF